MIRYICFIGSTWEEGEINFGNNPESAVFFMTVKLKSTKRMLFVAELYILTDYFFCKVVDQFKELIATV